MNQQCLVLTDLLGKILVVSLKITNAQWKPEYANMDNPETRELLGLIKKSVSCSSFILLTIEKRKRNNCTYRYKFW